MTPKLSFAPTQKLLRRCLEYPGQSYETLRALVGASSASVVRSWIDGSSTPRSVDAWPRIHAKVVRYHNGLKQRGADDEHCDPEWRVAFEMYLKRERILAATFAATVGMPEWHGMRWERFGEVPFDRVRRDVAARTGFDFTRSAYRRAIATARSQFGAPLLAPLDSVERVAADTSAGAVELHNAIQQALATVRDRSGKTSRALARAIGSSAPCLDYFASRMRRRLAYGAKAIAGMLVGLARYAQEHPEQFGVGEDGVAVAAIEEAKALIRSRPERRKGATRGRTTVRWDRIAKSLDVGTHRFLRYRCPSGAFAIVIFIRLAIAYEQSQLTTRELSAKTGFSTHRLGEWLNGRSFPDFVMLEKFEQALASLERTDGAHPPAREDTTPAPERSSGTRSPPERTSVPTEGAGDILVGVASTLRGVRAMRRAGWSPDAMAREHLVTIARSAMEIGGLAPDDLRPKVVAAVSSGGSAAVAAVREVLPTLRSTTPQGVPGTKRRR